MFYLPYLQAYTWAVLRYNDYQSERNVHLGIVRLLMIVILQEQGPRSDFVIGGASEREAQAFARGVRGDAPREILKFRPSAMAKNATKFVSCDKVCPIFI